jgi:large subunit ribosomal protein L24
MYARYRTRSRFYKRPEKALKAYNVRPNLLRRPKVKEGLLKGIYTDEKVDLRDRERLEMLEAIRHPKERDFYQDHTYHNQWIARDLEKHQKSQIASRYPYFAPNYEIKPWLWYPGDIVEVTSGEGVGQRGSIIAVVKYKNEILVQNINVQDVTIPASETRPEQVVQREHPISVHRVRHIDPSTNELCHLELVKVRNKETGELEERRISLESGALLPIPAPEETVEGGDPLKDTAIQDADEDTYDRAKELPLLVERRLQAMENYFVRTLKESYEFHECLRQRNAEDMLSFQKSVVARATEKLAATTVSPEDEEEQQQQQRQQQEDTSVDVKDTITAENVIAEVLKAEEKLHSSTAGLPGWWQEMIDSYVSALEEEEEAQAEEAAQQARSAAADLRAETLMADATADADRISRDAEGELQMDADDEDGELEEKEDEVDAGRDSTPSPA